MLAQAAPMRIMARLRWDVADAADDVILIGYATASGPMEVLADRPD